MQIAHILRKYVPTAWGGTETAVYHLVEGLQHAGVTSSIYCPQANNSTSNDPFAAAGCAVKRYRAFLPVAGIKRECREQLNAWGGNLMSWDLPGKLLFHPGLRVIHTHALNRLAGIALRVAQARRIPLVVTIHGGALDLPPEVHDNLTAPLRGGFEWGKIFGWLLNSRKVLAQADAILTCNPSEARLLNEKYPGQRVVAMPHALPAHLFAVDHRAAALKAFPQLAGRDVLLEMARLDPVKNQGWLVDQLPAVRQRHPRAMVVFVGSTTHAAHAAALRKQIENSPCRDSVLLLGGLAPKSPELIGLLQLARAMVFPSLAETFGLVITEAWAAGTPVITTRTSGALSLVRQRETGWLFDLDGPAEFHQAVDEALAGGELREQIVSRARNLVQDRYSIAALGNRMRALYEELLAQKRKGTPQ